MAGFNQIGDTTREGEMDILSHEWGEYALARENRAREILGHRAPAHMDEKLVNAVIARSTVVEGLLNLSRKAA